ncbi:flagellar motor protein MotA [Emcibacter sp.]|uniref:flagellar motor protein MotA n=1 Tax=Emcibacter sp. TaxID=1979954 RepID=UPI003A8DAB6B
MIRPTKYLNTIILFLTAVIVLVAVLFPSMEEAFLANYMLNGVIVTVLVIGILFSIAQVRKISTAVNWIQAFQKHDDPDTLPQPPAMLAPMAAMMEEDQRRKSLSALSLRTILDGIAGRMDESRETTRYLIGLLIFLGLLGTFWGLLGTIGSIKDTIDSLTVGSGDITHLFEDLKQGLAAPLGGMGTAFSSSLFGLAGSVILGFIDLQTGQAQRSFFNGLEDWLSGITKLSRGGGIVSEAGDGSVPAYVSALLEQTADSLDNLHKVISRSEEKRMEVNTALISLSEQIAGMSDSNSEVNSVLKKLIEVIALQQSGERDKTDTTHLRNIDVQMKHLLEETVKGQNQFTDDLRAEFKLLARTLGAFMDGREPPAVERGRPAPRKAPEASAPAPKTEPEAPETPTGALDYDMPEPNPKAKKTPVLTPKPLTAKRDED